MRSLPLSLLKESFRSGANLAKPSPSSNQLRRFSSIPIALTSSSTQRRSLDISICLRCQLRAQTRFYSTQGSKGTDSVEENKDTSPQKPADVDSFSNAEKVGSVENTGQEKQQEKDAGRWDFAKLQLKHGLPSQWESRRSQFSKKFGNLMDNLQSNVFNAGRHLNDLTGYTAIEKLKQDILAQEEHVRQTRANVRQAKDAYSSAINRRSTSQREVNELLQRKHAWNPTDLERFTSLYRSDHANERAETDTQEALAAAEREAEEATASLSKSILGRYHEEQIWSDKIRRMSTWGTWGLMGVNVLLFLIFQIAVEPWRRKRLVKGFEEKVAEALEKGNVHPTADVTTTSSTHDQNPPSSPATTATSIISSSSSDLTENATTTSTQPIAEADSVSAAIAPPTEEQISPPATTPSSSPSDIELVPESLDSQSQSQPLTTLLPPDASISPDSWRQTLHDFFSERRVTLSQRDLTTVALESAAAGAAVMGVLIAIFRPR